MAEWNKKNQPEKGNTNVDPDDFWDVEKLLPDRPMSRPKTAPRPTPTAVELEVPTRGETSAQGSTPARSAGEPVASVPLTLRRPADGDPAPAPEKDKPTPVVEYSPDGLLLHTVRIFPWQAGYHYFDSFVEDAQRFHDMKPPRSAEKTSYFSYFPQYTQMNRRATAWYLFWRERVRQGEYPDTDYAYVLLYLFELINLPVNTPAEGRARRDLMAKVWVAYRKPFPQLDQYMCEWLCDYCLIHCLTAPIDLLAPALDTIIQGSRLKEFYLSAAVRLSGDGSGREDTALQTARILLRHCCQYDYRKSKFASGEHKALFDSTIPAAVAHVLPMLLGANGQKPAGKPAITMLESTVTRDAYVGALCSYRNKRRIEVSYTSFSRSHELRFLMGDMVKHVENRLRSWIGVRSRLSAMSLPIPLREALDAYLAPLEPPKSAMPIKKKEEPRPAYEALYDLPRKAVSLTDAAAIEAQSWETTKILVEAFGVDDGAENDVALCGNDVPLRGNDVPLRGNDVATDVADDVSLRDNDVRRASSANDATPAAQMEETSPLSPYAPFIKAALDGDPSALRAAAKALGKMPDALADEINAITADGEIGDIILEDDGMGCYTVIEDYREQIIELLCM